MAEFLRPDVYVIEKTSSRRPLSAVTTSTAAIVGLTEKGPVSGETIDDKPVLCTSWSGFLDVFGKQYNDYLTPEAAFQFFNNGGQRLWVSRVIGASPVRAFLNLNDTGTPTAVIKIEARSLGAYGNDITITVAAGTVSGKKVTIVDENGLAQVLDNVANDVDDFAAEINESAVAVKATVLAQGNNTLANVAATNLATGSDGTAPTLASEFEGTSANRKGLFGLDTVDESLIVMAPEVTGLSGSELALFANAANAYCEARMDCFFLVDSKNDLTVTTAQTFFDALTASTYGSKYWPWVVAAGGNGNVELPPSPFVAAKMSKIDKEIGVHQPAAGTDFPLQGVVSFKYDVLDSEQDVLNPKGINVLRFFQGYGPVIWGARTMGTDPDFRYNSVRRLFILVEKTLKDGTKPFVFKPNTPDLRDNVQATVRDFLIKVWRDGALKGRTIQEAFFVKCDDENNPPETQDEGKLIIQVGLAATRPAEFVIFEVGHLRDGATSVTE